MLTACGIETVYLERCFRIVGGVATVLTACGIETYTMSLIKLTPSQVATVLTACGIETYVWKHIYFILLELQQCLPLAVLKLL